MYSNHTNPVIPVLQGTYGTLHLLYKYLGPQIEYSIILGIAGIQNIGYIAQAPSFVKGVFCTIFHLSFVVQKESSLGFERQRLRLVHPA